ncbi:hypothetical protein [Roseivirga sp.]|uniref:hypothetical protein n=1 Tax=Roseivirga sp. TaxID=1964215 RepID=UPI002B27581B|nr:hypothetical protein [Roseivirga sp.]
MKLVQNQSTMSLTVEQIAAIKAFINKRGFNTIEVEMEALDHMASKVETLLEEKPDMNFDLAITKAHADLGIFGFATFEDAILEGIKVGSRRKFKQELISYLTTPKALVLLGLIILGFSIQQTFFENLTAITIMGGFFFYGLLLSSIPIYNYWTTFKEWGKKSLVIQNSIVGFYITFFLFARGLGDITRIEFTDGSRAFPFLFTLTFVLITLSALISVSIMKWSINSFTEKWLKYA